MVKNLPARQETQATRVRSLGGEDPLEEGGHSNPLQYSCLGNPMDAGAWQATVHGFSESRTWQWACTHTHYKGCMWLVLNRPFLCCNASFKAPSPSLSLLLLFSYRCDLEDLRKKCFKFPEAVSSNIFILITTPRRLHPSKGYHIWELFDPVD